MDGRSGNGGSAWQTTEFAAREAGHSYLRELARSRLEEPVHLADVAHEIADGRDGVDPKSVYVMLYHVHAPKLADEGLLSFDADRRTVSAPESNAVRPRSRR